MRRLWNTAADFWRLAEPEPSTACLVWARSKSSNGYGQTRFRSRLYRAHRVAFILAKGEIPPGCEIDHMCGRKACINPEPLRAVSHRENILSSNAPNAVAIRTGICPNGHDRRIVGTNSQGSSGRRTYKACKRDSSRQWRHRNRVASTTEQHV